MDWEIRGTKDGKPVRAKVTAASEESARNKAQASGVVVKLVLPLDSANAPQAAPAAPRAAPAQVAARSEGMAQTDAPAYAPPAPSTAYGNPLPYASPATSQNRFTGLGIASLCCGCGAAVFGLLSFCLWPISLGAGITGIVLGCVAWSMESKRGNRRGRKMAVAGTFTSVGGIVLTLVIFFGFFALIRVRAQAQRAAAQAALASPNNLNPPAAQPTPHIQGFPAPPSVPPPPPRPTAGQLAAKLKKIETTWQPSTAATTDLLAIMKVRRAARDGDSMVLHSGGQLQTLQPYRAPLTLRLVAMSDHRDTRIAFGSRIIFNWEMHRDELRIDGGPADASHKPGAGQLPFAQWAGIEMVVEPNQLVLYVDGVERQRVSADFSKVHDKLTVEARGGDVSIKSITLCRPISP